MNWQGDFAGAALLTVCFVLLLGVAEAWARLRNPHPELTRKAVHIGGGAAALALPFLIESIAAATLLTLSMAALLLLGSRTGLLRSLHRVERRTRGSEYYPVAVLLVFLMTLGQRWIYISAVLTLAVADAFAALVGGSYGRLRYQVETEKKSLEGSLVFLVIAFLAILIPALLMTDLPRPVCVLAALIVAILVTGFEAISLHGTDNIFVPVAVAAILAKITAKPQPEVVYQVVSLAAICGAITLLARRFRAFNTGATVTLILFVYGAWSLGSRMWALPAAIALLIYLLYQLVLPRAARRFPDVRVRVMFRALLPPLTMLILANSTSQYHFFYGPYAASCAAVPALSIWAFSDSLAPAAGARRWLRAAGLAAATGTLVCLPPWLYQGAGPGPLLAALGGVVMAVAAEAFSGRGMSGSGEDRFWPARRIAIVYALCGIIMVLQLAGLAGLWSPAEDWPV